MSDRQKQTWSSYILMTIVFMLVFSTILPLVVKDAVHSIKSVPILELKLDSIDENQKLILENQHTAIAERAICREHSRACEEDINRLRGFHK